MNAYFYHVITLFGGISLFLYGLSQATDSFRSAFSTGAREAVSRFTRKKIRALLFGTVLAAVAQGSTVSTSIAIGLADVGLLSLAGSAVVMMGANVGGTFVTLLVSLDVVKLAPLLMAVSYSMVRLGRGRTAKIGGVLHAVSLLLVGMFLMKMSVQPLLNNAAARNAIAFISSEPPAVFFAAMAGTAVLQSTASVMAVAVAVASSGALPQSAVFPVTLGAYLGTSVTILLAASGGRRNARVLGAATFLYKLTGVAAFIPLIPWASAFLDEFAAMPGRLVLAQALVAAFNAALFYPWPQALLKGGAFMISRQRAASLGTPAYIDDELLEIPSIAVRLLSKEMIRLANYIEAFLQMRLYPEKLDKNAEELEKLLSPAITELTEACENYAHSIRPSSYAEDPLALLEYRTVTYAMTPLREVSRIAAGPFREMTLERPPRPEEEMMDGSQWDAMTSLFMKILRDAFHAFALGDGELIKRAALGEKMFDKSAAALRSKLLRRGASRESGKGSKLMDFVAAEGRLARAAVDMVREGDADIGQK